MDTNTIIAISVISALLFAVLIHSWAHKILTFKMHESSIIQVLTESSSEKALSLHSIAAAADISENRALAVCQKSTLLIEDSHSRWLKK